LHYVLEITVTSGVQNCHVIQSARAWRKDAIGLTVFFSVEFRSRPSRRARPIVGQKRSKKNGKKVTARMPATVTAEHRSENLRENGNGDCWTAAGPETRTRQDGAATVRKSVDWLSHEVQKTRTTTATTILLKWLRCCAKPN